VKRRSRADATPANSGAIVIVGDVDSVAIRLCISSIDRTITETAEGGRPVERSATASVTGSTVSAPRRMAITVPAPRSAAAAVGTGLRTPPSTSV
jgi:hypothetical protein